jgi:conjugal transfer/type IV secretion protein DotA/TraY
MGGLSLIKVMSNDPGGNFDEGSGDMLRSFVLRLALAAMLLAVTLPGAAFASPPPATPSSNGLGMTAEDCQANFILICIPDTDISAGWIASMFSKLVTFRSSDETDTTPSTGPDTVFADLLQTVNAAALAVGSLLLTYKLFAGIVQTANDGEVLGKRWSTFWGPIRVAASASLIVPTTSGFCLAQALVVALALTGVGLANTMWYKMVDGMITPNGMVSPQVLPQYGKIARGVFASNLCVHFANYYFVSLHRGDPDTYKLDADLSGYDYRNRFWLNNFHWAGDRNIYATLGGGAGPTPNATTAYPSPTGGLFFRTMNWEGGGGGSTDGMRMAWGPVDQEGFWEKIFNIFGNGLPAESCGVLSVRGITISPQEMDMVTIPQARLGLARVWCGVSGDSYCDEMDSLESSSAVAQAEMARLEDNANLLGQQVDSMTRDVVGIFGGPLKTLALKLDEPAATIAARIVNNYSPGATASNVDSDIAVQGQKILEAAAEFRTSVVSNMRTRVDAIFNDNSVINTYKTIAKDGGWVVAGEWYLQLMKMNALMQRLTAITPEFDTERPIDIVAMCRESSLCRGNARHMFTQGQTYVANYFQRAVTAATRDGMTTDNMGPRLQQLRIATGAFGSNNISTVDDDSGASAVIAAVSASVIVNLLRVVQGGDIMSAVMDIGGAALFANLDTVFPGGDEAVADGTRHILSAGGLVADTDAANPISAVIAVGRSLWRNGLVLMYSADDGNWSNKDRAAVALLTDGDYAQSEVTGQIGSAVARAAGRGSSMQLLLSRIGGLMLIPGFLLGYLFPFLPWLLWIGGLVGWIILVIEAVIAAPLWALAHMRMDGEGIMGPAGQQGYMLVLALVLRPALMLMGLVAGQMLIFIFVPFVGVSIATTMTLGHSSGANVDMMGQIMTIALLGFVLVTVCYKAFGLIHQIPDRVLRWIGSGSGNQGEDEFRSGAMAIVQTGSIGSLASAASGNDQLGGEGGGGGGGGGSGASASRSGNATNALSRMIAPPE